MNSATIGRARCTISPPPARRRARYANREAISYFQSALALTALAPDDAQRSQQELDLRMALGRALADIHGFTAELVRENYERADALCAALNSVGQRFEVLYALWYPHALRAERDEATALATELSGIAHGLAPAEHGVLADSVLLRTAAYEGRFMDASAWMQSLRSRQCAPSDAPVQTYGMDARIAAALHYAAVLWFLGDPAGARAENDQALARALKSGNPFFQCGAMVQTALVELLCRRPERAADLTKRAGLLAAEQGFGYWAALAAGYRGYALIQQGHERKGDAEIAGALQFMHAAHAHLFTSHLLAFRAEGCWRSGAVADGLTAVNEGLRLAQMSLDRSLEPELWRLRGELLLGPTAVGRHRRHPGKRARVTSANPDDNWPEAERSLVRALELSRAAQARSFELRAATSLAGAWRTRGRVADAAAVLTGVCDWFGNAPHNVDLVEARTLLSELCSSPRFSTRRWNVSP